MFAIMHSHEIVGGFLAYFDPGSGSLFLQVLLGGTAGLIVFAKYLWEQAPAWLRRPRPAVVEIEAERPAPKG